MRILDKLFGRRRAGKVVVDEAMHALAGRWQLTDAKFMLEINPGSDDVRMRGWETDHGQRVEVLDVSWDGETLKFTTFFPPTKMTVVHTLQAVDVGTLKGHRSGSSSGPETFKWVGPLKEIVPITQSDVDAIREYWRHRAKEWWKTESRSEVICDSCNSLVSRDAGYLSASWFLCQRCCDRRLGSDALKHLRRDPNHFGVGTLDQARRFVRTR